LEISLRDRLTLGGRLPLTYEEVRTRLLDLDGARAAFIEAGLSTSNLTENNRTEPNRTRIVAQTNAQAGPRPSTQSYRGRNGRNPATAQGRAAQTPTQEVRMSRTERDRRFREGLCLRCGGNGHFAKECQGDVVDVEQITARAGIIIEEEDDQEVVFVIDQETGDIRELEEEGNEEGAQNALPQL
jgi:hypothetical protein